MTIERGQRAPLFARAIRASELERALRIAALSPGWRASFEALLQSASGRAGATGNAGLAPAAAAHRGGARVSAAAGHADRSRESADVLSLLAAEPRTASRSPAAAARPVRRRCVCARSRAGRRSIAATRSRGRPPTERYRISVKIEPNGAAGSVPARAASRVGDVARRQRAARQLRPAAGRGPGRAAQRGHRRDAGAGDAARAGGGRLDPREVWWLHGARDRRAPSVRRRSAAPVGGARARAQPRLLQQARRAATSWARTSTPPDTCRGRPSTRSACRATAISTSAGRPASWAT